MLTILDLALTPAAVSFIIAAVSVPPIIFFAKKFNIIDDPRKNKHPKVIHTYPIPRAGGTSPYIAILLTSVAFLPLDKHLVGILFGASLVTITGIVDDKYNLNPYKRLIIQFLAAAFPIAAGIGIAYANNPFGTGVINLSYPRYVFDLLGKTRSLWILSDLFALFWIVFLMNILNMGAKGVDGQLPGVVVIAATTIAVLSLKYSADVTQWPVIILASIVAGAYLGFLPWNFYPQKIMPGFSGSTLAGYTLAVLSILSTAKVGTLMVVLGVPLIDTGYTIVRRVSQGKSPVWGDRKHLHHKLLDYGFSKRSVSYLYWIATASLGFIAINLNASNKLYTIVGVTILIGGLLLWFTYRPKS
jgi:UDP-GlcNAc:undecaprenyl-phosphate GlcNAc-1-phosphate transferase